MIRRKKAKKKSIKNSEEVEIRIKEVEKRISLPLKLNKNERRHESQVIYNL